MPGSAYGAQPCSYIIPLSSGMFSGIIPRISNLELGFLYTFGKNVRTGRFTADYLLPFRLNGDSVLFGEAHAEGWDFWKRPSVSVAAVPDSPQRLRNRTTGLTSLSVVGTARCWVRTRSWEQTASTTRPACSINGIHRVV